MSGSGGDTSDTSVRETDGTAELQHDSGPSAHCEGGSCQAGLPCEWCAKRPSLPVLSTSDLILQPEPQDPGDAFSDDEPSRSSDNSDSSSPGGDKAGQRDERDDNMRPWRDRRISTPPARTSSSAREQRRPRHVRTPGCDGDGAEDRQRQLLFGKRRRTAARSRFPRKAPPDEDEDELISTSESDSESPYRYRDGSGDDDDDDYRPPSFRGSGRKRVRRTTTNGDSTLQFASSRRNAASPYDRRQGRPSLSQRGTRTSRGAIPSPPSSQPSYVEAFSEAAFANFEEWPLGNAVLKRVMNGTATFQLQFTWDPCGKHGHGHEDCPDEPQGDVARPKRHHTVTGSGIKGAAFTAGEDALIIELKEVERLSWKELHQQFTATFPGRSVGTLQVRYCTKLKKRSRTVGR